MRLRKLSDLESPFKFFYIYIFFFFCFEIQSFREIVVHSGKAIILGTENRSGERGEGRGGSGVHNNRVCPRQQPHFTSIQNAAQACYWSSFCFISKKAESVAVVLRLITAPLWKAGRAGRAGRDYHGFPPMYNTASGRQSNQSIM